MPKCHKCRTGKICHQSYQKVRFPEDYVAILPINLTGATPMDRLTSGKNGPQSSAFLPHLIGSVHVMVAAQPAFYWLFTRHDSRLHPFLIGHPKTIQICTFVLFLATLVYEPGKIAYRILPDR